MTRICLLVELDIDDQARDPRAPRTPQALRDEVMGVLMENYWRPTVELTAHEPAHAQNVIS